MFGKADKIYMGGAVYSGSSQNLWAEALATSGSRILALGTESDILGLKGEETQIHDLEGGLLMPSFSDLHTHFVLGCLSLREINLRRITGREEFRTKVREAVEHLKPGEWLTGGYWNEELWDEPVLPDKSWIDDLTPENPVFLYRTDIHHGLCNSLALKLTGWYENRKNPDGGEIARDSNGIPDGNIYERACTLVWAEIPRPDRNRIRESLNEGMRYANSLGITNIADMVEGPEDVELYFQLAKEEQLTCRMELNFPLPQRQTMIASGLKTGVGLGLAELGPMKGFMDGSIGSRTAFMEEEYSNDPGNFGYPLDMADPPEKMLQMMKEAADAGFSTAVHAIGDRSNRILLDLYENLKSEGGYPGYRFRVEHAQHLSPQLIPRFRDLDLIVSMQPVHLMDDGCFIEDLLGENRAGNSYACRSLLKADCKVMFNTDWPVADLNPLTGIQVAVTRQTSDGKNPEGWIPEEKVSVEEAVRAYTSTPAYAQGKENALGLLLPGFEADMVHLDRNFIRGNPSDIGSTKVIGTFLSGKMVFSEV